MWLHISQINERSSHRCNHRNWKRFIIYLPSNETSEIYKYFLINQLSRPLFYQKSIGETNASENESNNAVLLLDSNSLH